MKKKTSLFIALVLALSLALSPVSVFAEDLDTPVHEDPIDELQESSGWVNGHFTVYDGNRYAEFDVRVYCEYNWTEGISSWIDTAVYDVTNPKVNGAACTSITSYATNRFSRGTCGVAEKKFIFYHPYFSYICVGVAIEVLCDNYGDLSISAHVW